MHCTLRVGSHSSSGLRCASFLKTEGVPLPGARAKGNRCETLGSGRRHRQAARAARAASPTRKEAAAPRRRERPSSTPPLKSDPRYSFGYILRTVYYVVSSDLPLLCATVRREDASTHSIWKDTEQVSLVGSRGHFSPGLRLHNVSTCARVSACLPSAAHSAIRSSASYSIPIDSVTLSLRAKTRSCDTFGN